MERVPTIADLRIMTDFTVEHRYLLRLWRQILGDDKRIKSGDKSPEELRAQWESQNMKEWNSQVQQWGGIKARGNKIGSNLYKAPSTSTYQTSSLNPDEQVLQDVNPHNFTVIAPSQERRVIQDINRWEAAPEFTWDIGKPFVCRDCKMGLWKNNVMSPERQGCRVDIQRFKCPECGRSYYLPLSVITLLIVYMRLEQREVLTLCLSLDLSNIWKG